jgi:hypothetical protein
VDLPPDLDYAAAFLAFGVEGFLFGNHLHGRSHMDVMVCSSIPCTHSLTRITITKIFYFQNLGSHVFILCHHGMRDMRGF